MNKLNQFTDWICGVEGAKFPFFRNMPEVPMPINYEEEKDKQIDAEIEQIQEEDKEETLCGKPHDGCDMSEENCSECMAIKLGI